jgi:predicted metal-dependent hydrolase
MPIIQDKEFGKIIVRRSVVATQIRVRVAPDGTLRASLPMRTPMFLVKHLLKNSREELRAILAQSKPVYEYKDGLKVGKSHTLVIQESTDEKFSVARHKLQIVVNLPDDKHINSPDVSRKIRDAIIAALRIEAKSYLPNRLSYLANKFGLGYEKVRFSHASGRWGSYSSNGTVSLNIALMKLPFELIDYIIIHELAHSKQMNHSKTFWSLVESADPDYRIHRRELKQHTPSI